MLLPFSTCWVREEGSGAGLGGGRERAQSRQELSRCLGNGVVGKSQDELSPASAGLGDSFVLPIQGELGNQL